MTDRRAKTHCPYCGSTLVRKPVDGRVRGFCERCRQPLYENPVPATAVVAVDARDRILMVKRNVDPKAGSWCLPGGFMELGETPEQAALRELNEETGMTGRIDRLLGVVAAPNASYDTVLMVGYLLLLPTGRLHPGDDADAVAFVSGAELPPVAFDSHAEFIRTFYTQRGLAPPRLSVVP